MDIKDQNTATPGRDKATRAEAARGDKPRGGMNSRQKLKNWALAGLLVALAVLFYFITIVRFGNHG